MTSSDFFHDRSEMVSYPWEYEVLRDWIVQYYKFMRAVPEVASAIKERKSEFEMIPIPKVLSRQLTEIEMHERTEFRGASSLDAEMILATISDVWKKSFQPDTTLKANVAGLLKLKHYPVLAELVRQFGKHLEKGAIDEAMKFIAEDYMDYSGRSKEALKSALLDLVRSSSDRRIIFVHAEKFETVDNMIAANVSGAWEAKIGKNEKGSSEFFKLEILFQQNQGGTWQIQSIKHE